MKNWLTEKVLRFLGISQPCRNVLILLLYLVWSITHLFSCSAADSHLRVLDRNLNAIRFFIPGLSVDLWHQCAMTFLGMLFKTYHNLKHSLNLDLNGRFYPSRITTLSILF